MSEERKFGGAPVIVAYFDKDDKEMKITREEHFNIDNFQMADWQVEALARALLPQIRKYYETHELPPEMRREK